MNALSKNNLKSSPKKKNFNMNLCTIQNKLSYEITSLYSTNTVIVCPNEPSYCFEANTSAQ